jgi:hypothetical protein
MDRGCELRSRERNPGEPEVGDRVDPDEPRVMEVEPAGPAADGLRAGPERRVGRHSRFQRRRIGPPRGGDFTLREVLVAAVKDRVL